MILKTLQALLIIAAALAITACGESSNEPRSKNESDADDQEGSFNLADLPGDFPSELIPPSYERVDYADMMMMNGVRAASFESTENVQGAIDHYIGLLGEPTINVDSGDGDRLLQWHESPYPPWVVNVMGNAGETLVSVGTMPGQYER